MKFYNIHSHQLVFLANELVISNLFPTQGNIIKTGKYYSIGLHPWYIKKEIIDQSLKEIQKLSQAQEVIAIGETGLDKVIETPFKLQMEVFERHIQISESIKKPLIIHCVKSFNELIQLKKKLKPKSPWIVHGFNSKAEVAEMLMKHKIILSFGKALMYPMSNAAIVLSQISDDSFFLETDDSEHSIKDIYEAAAKIKKIDLDHLKSIVLQNFKNCFEI